MQMIRFIFLVVVMIGASTVQSQVAESKGMGSVNYSSWKIKPVDKEKALVNAKMSAIERYIAGDSISKMKNFDLIRGDVSGDVDTFLLATNVVSEDLDKDAKKYTVVVRAEINVNRLNQVLQEMSAVGNATEGEKSYITFIFVSRQQSSVKRYDEKRVKRTDKESSVDGVDVESASGAGIEYASEEYRSDTVTSGGSSTQKMDKIEYKVGTSEGINSVMTNVFGSSGFEVVEAEYLEEETGGLISIEAFKDDYSHGDDISAETKRNAAKGAKSVDVAYVAVGTLDVGIKDKDPVSGLDRIYVTVSGKVIDVQKRFPKTVASIGPVQFSGTGPSQTVAMNNALTLAAENAATELAEQLNSRGVK